MTKTFEWFLTCLPVLDHPRFMMPSAGKTQDCRDRIQAWAKISEPKDFAQHHPLTKKRPQCAEKRRIRRRLLMVVDSLTRWPIFAVDSSRLILSQKLPLMNRSSLWTEVRHGPLRPTEALASVVSYHDRPRIVRLSSCFCIRCWQRLGLERWTLIVQ